MLPVSLQRAERRHYGAGVVDTYARLATLSNVKKPVARASRSCAGLNPVRAADELRVESEILEVPTSRSRPDQGIVKVRITTFNQQDEPVQVGVVKVAVQCRPVGTA